MFNNYISHGCCIIYIAYIRNMTSRMCVLLYSAVCSGNGVKKRWIDYYYRQHTQRHKRNKSLEQNKNVPFARRKKWKCRNSPRASHCVVPYDFSCQLHFRLKTSDSIFYSYLGSVFFFFLFFSYSFIFKFPCEVKIMAKREHLFIFCRYINAASRLRRFTLSSHFPKLLYFLFPNV